VVHESIAEGRAIENEPCVEAFMRGDQNKRGLLNGYFTLGPVDTISWLLNVAHIAGEPSYAVTASPVEEDVPPTALPGGGVTSQGYLRSHRIYNQMRWHSTLRLTLTSRDRIWIVHSSTRTGIKSRAMSWTDLGRRSPIIRLQRGDMSTTDR
jgi:hypothetical protein